MTRIKFLLALWLARLCRWAINIVAPGRGTNRPQDRSWLQWPF